MKIISFILFAVLAIVTFILLVFNPLNLFAQQNPCMASNDITGHCGGAYPFKPDMTKEEIKLNGELIDICIGEQNMWLKKIQTLYNQLAPAIPTLGKTYNDCWNKSVSPYWVDLGKFHQCVKDNLSK